MGVYSEHQAHAFSGIMFQSVSEYSFIQAQMSVVQVCIEFLTLTFTGATVLIAFLAYKGFVKDKLREKQLEEVLALIETLRSSSFLCGFITNQEPIINFSSSFNIFTIVSPQANTSISLFHPSLSRSSKIYLSYQVILFFEGLTNFETSPLLPRETSRKLSLFQILLTDIQDFAPTLSNPYPVSAVVIGDMSNPNVVYNISDFLIHQIQYQEASAFISWGGFTDAFHDLVESIRDWMSSVGITDLNL